MAGRRGARSGRGWDAIPPRAGADGPDDGTPGESARGEPRRGFGRGGASARRRRSETEDEGLWQTFGSSSEPGESPEETVTPEPPAGRSAGSGGWAGRDETGPPSGEGRSRRRRDPDAVTDGRGGSGAADPGAVGRRPGSDGETRRPAQLRQTESERAREICLRQLAARPRTRAELAKALTRKEISEEVIAEVLDRYDEVGIIDDAAFARAWVSSRHHGRGLARRALANELRQRGVDAEVAGEALESVDDESEAETARALVDRKLRTATGTPEAIFRRLVAMLARKGYPAGIAIRAVKDALAARDEEAAEFADNVDADALADQADPLS